MTTLKFYDKKNTVHQPDIEVEIMPEIGDFVRISGVRHRVASREFYIDHGQIQSVELELEDAE